MIKRNPSFVIRKIYGLRITHYESQITPLEFIMFKNYLKIAWRSLLKNRLFSLINVLGLAVGMTFAMLIGLWVKYELSFDTFHKNRERVAIILKDILFNDEKTTQFTEPLP